MFTVPMSPAGGPPVKKQRASGTPQDRLSLEADEAIARRRADLRRLQQMRGDNSSKNDLMARAQAQLSRAPPGRPMDRVRHSDIFPNAPKGKVPPPPPRRLDESFQPRSRSAPPSRSPPPPPPQHQVSPGAPTPSERGFMTRPDAVSASALVQPEETSSPSLVAQTPHSKVEASDDPTKADAGRTPFPMKRTGESTPSETPRADRIQSMLQFAQDSTPVESPELRMQKKLRQLENEKKDALLKVASLENELSSLHQQRGDAASTMEHVPSGPFALKVPMTPVLTSPLRLKRSPTPHPKQGRVDPVYLEQASELIPFVYETDLNTSVSFTIRRPYGLDAQEAEFWKGHGHATNYSQVADAGKVVSLEVAAKAAVDGSVVLLFGEEELKRKSGGDWEEYGKVADRTLGAITYIDSDASEREYSLDEIYEGMRAVREHYCSSLVSTAAALERRPRDGVPPLIQESMPSATKAEPSKDTRHICVGTEDMPLPTPQPQIDSPEKRALEPSKKHVPQPIDDQPDALSTSINMFVSLIGTCIWTIVIKIPMWVLSTISFLVIACALLTIAWLHMVEVREAFEMGALSGASYNRAGTL